PRAFRLMRILLAENDDAIAGTLVPRLEASGMIVDRAEDGEVARYQGLEFAYAAIILDLGLPALDGLTVLDEWRSSGITTPVLILTARGGWRDKVSGLRAGADDYLAKPFETEELIARIEALVRRSGGHAAAELRIGGLSLDLARRLAARDGAPITLTPNEYRALTHLAMNRGRCITKVELAEQIYAEDADRDPNVIEVTIARLRKKVGAELIQTRRGHGYIVE
ncbi:MAG: response regulator transcription factor, partial [Pseudomonadota bacterium]